MIIIYILRDTKLIKGRGFNEAEIIESGRSVALLGLELVKRRFLMRGKIHLQKIISIGSGKYKVVGILKEKGSGFGNNSDMVCFIPYTNTRNYFSRPNMNFDIQVRVEQSELIEAATGQAEVSFQNSSGT